MEIPIKRAASGVRRSRGGRPAIGSGINITFGLRIVCCRRRQRVLADRGGETVAWSVPYLRTCADGTPEPKCLNRRVELCRPGSNGLARVLPVAQLDRVVQQRSVTAPHHVLTRCHETARFVFARIAFPIGLGATKAEQNFGDGPVALAALARVER